MVTALTGAVMCVQQRHLKRLLAYSTIAHVGLFLVAAGVLDADGTAGAALYVAGHAGVKGALFLLAGSVLTRYRSVDELHLHGRGHGSPITLRWMFVLAGLALAGVPAFGTGLGKAVGEDAVAHAGYGWGAALFVVVSAATGGAVLQATGRIFFALGPVPSEDEQDRTTGDEEQPEVPGSGTPLRVTMLLPALGLLVCSLLIGVVPAVREWFAAGAGQFIDRARFIDRAGFVSGLLAGRAGPARPSRRDRRPGVAGGALRARRRLRRLAAVRGGRTGRTGRTGLL